MRNEFIRNLLVGPFKNRKLSQMQKKLFPLLFLELR